MNSALLHLAAPLNMLPQGDLLASLAQDWQVPKAALPHCSVRVDGRQTWGQVCNKDGSTQQRKLQAYDGEVRSSLVFA